MTNDTLAWRADGRHLVCTVGQPIDQEAVGDALDILEREIAAHRQSYEFVGENIEPPIDIDATAAEIVGLVERLRRDVAIIAAAPRPSEIAPRLGRIEELAKGLRSCFENADQVTLSQLGDAGLFRYLAAIETAIRGEDDNRDDDFGRLLLGERAFVTKLIQAIENSAARARAKGGDDPGGPRKIGDLTVAKAVVEACWRVFDIHCPSRISAAPRSGFVAFIDKVAWLVDPKLSGFGRQIEAAAERQKRALEGRRTWRRSPEGLYADFQTVYERRVKAEAIVDCTAEEMRPMDAEVAAELDSIRRELTELVEREQILKAKLHEISDKL